jgi:hypothetical protein
MPPGSTLAFIATAFLKPWAFDRQPAEIPRGSAIWLAAIFVTAAAVLATGLSTWTYLIGKGLILAVGEMDMGRDDLPADTIGQVAGAFIGSIATWMLLLSMAVLVCLAVADLLYAHDRSAWRVAARRTGALTIWFVVWAILVLAINAVRQDEIRHPAAAIRAYAQLSQRWFRGTSAQDPGPIEREPLVAHGRMRGLAFVFPIIWSFALPRPSRGRRLSRPVVICAAIALSWIAWGAVWRLLPWTAVDTFAG